MKKKRLNKLSFTSLGEKFQAIDEDLLRKIVGGGYVSGYSINGGTITNWDYAGEKYAVYTDASGKEIILDGVHVGSNTLPFQFEGTACYFNGEIRINGWDSFEFNDLMHEYGHYLQEQSMGIIEYYAEAVGSAGRVFRGDKEHDQHYFEQDATARGQSYAASYYNYPMSY